MGGFTTLVYGITEAGALKPVKRCGWATAACGYPDRLGGVLLVAFVITELLVNDPVMDVRLFTQLHLHHRQRADVGV